MTNTTTNDIPTDDNRVLVGRYVTLTDEAREEICEWLGPLAMVRDCAHKVYDRRGAKFVIVPVERDIHDPRREVLDHKHSLTVWDDQIQVITGRHFHGDRA
jgi:hypothetical protein